MSGPKRTALVLGASGDQGLPQALLLAGVGWRVRAGTRQPERFAALLAGTRDIPAHSVPAGAMARIAPVIVDYRDPATLAHAMNGVDVLLANYPSSSFHDGAALQAAAEATGAAAAQAGVPLIVFNTSLPLPPCSRGFRAQDIRFRQRDTLRATGVPVISIQPVVYMDNLLRGWVYPGILDEDVFAYPHSPALEVSWICQYDLAQLMVAAAERPALGGRDFNVGGPQALRGTDVARILSGAAGRPIRFESQPVEEFCARLRLVFEHTATLDADVLVAELGRVYRWYNEAPERPFRIDMAPVLRELPVRLTSFARWARRQRWSR